MLAEGRLAVGGGRHGPRSDVRPQDLELAGGRWPWRPCRKQHLTGTRIEHTVIPPQADRQASRSALRGHPSGGHPMRRLPPPQSILVSHPAGDRRIGLGHPGARRQLDHGGQSHRRRLAPRRRQRPVECLPTTAIFHADGTYIQTDGTGTGIGSWAATGPNSGDLTLTVYGPGQSEGEVGGATVRGSVRVRGDGALIGTFSLEYSGADQHPDRSSSVRPRRPGRASRSSRWVPN